MIRPVRQDGTIETGGPFVPIRRSRVVERIAAVAIQRIALIIAPAGYGKSVALRQYLETIDRPHVRYDLRSEHSELLGFLRGLCDALGDQAPYARAALAGAYDRNAGSASPGLDLAQWMHTHLEAFSGVIAIDDLHVAQHDREVTRLIASLIERTKGRVEWIIASRTTQGLPIGTWLAYGESDLSVDEHDLRFTVDEAKDAARSCRLGVREEELYDLLQLTDGWATAVSFALRTSTRSIDLRQMPTITRDMIYSYLAEQVYDELSDEERDFLETAALLVDIEPAVMVAAGFDRTDALLEDVSSRVAFLHYDKDSGIYRCHDLFREFLVHQLVRRGVEETKRRRIQLAQTFERIGRESAAMRMYVQASSVPDVQRMLGIGFDLLEEGQADIVQAALRVLERVPQDVTPVAKALRGISQISAGNYEEGERQLLACLPLLDDGEIFGRVSLKLAMLSVNRLGNPTEIIEKLFARPDVPQTMHIEARSILAVYRARVEGAEDAESLLMEVQRDCDSINDVGLRARLLQRLGVASSQLLHGTNAEAMLEESAQLAQGVQLWSVRSRALNSLAVVVLYAEYDTGAALRHTREAAIAARKAGDFLDLQTSLLIALTIEVRRGNDSSVREIEQELAQLRAADRTAAVFVVSSQAHRAAWEGRMGDAHRLFAGIVQRQPREPDRAMTQAFFALCLAMDDRTNEVRSAVEGALKTIDNAHVAADAMDSLYFETARLFVALAELLSGRATSTTKILKKPTLSTDPIAIRIRACVEAVARLVKSPQYEASVEISPALEYLHSRGFGGYARYIDLGHRHFVEKMTGSIEVKLTGAELRILRYVASGLTPKEIAAEMGRSVLTIRAHVRNVIEKLGCRGNAEAISTARRMGLLEDT